MVCHRRDGRNWPIALAVGIATLVGGSCYGGATYTSPATDLHIVDQDGAPVSNALILLTWKLSGAHDVTIRYLQIFEGRTDTSGRVSIPKWGPQTVTDGLVAADQPHLRIFKAGYLAAFQQNSSDTAGYRSGSVLSMKWSGSPVVLIKSPATTDEYKDALRSVALTLKFYVRDQQCLIREAHEMLDAVRAELERVNADYPYPISLVPNRAGCAAAS